MNSHRLCLIVLTSILASACSSVSVRDYAGQQPALVMADFFEGELNAYGIVKDW